MKHKYHILIIIAALFLLIKCEGGPTEPVEYTHTQAGFKITAPGGWKKMSEDEEMYEFRMGNFKLIEVGGFDLEMTADDFEDISDDEFVEMLTESTMDGLDGYCDEAGIANYTVKDEAMTTWGGKPAYRVLANGFSEEADKSMTVDLIAMVNKNNGYMYMFASQIADDAYQSTKADLETCIKSFKLTQ